MRSESIAKAWTIAHKALKECYKGPGIIAGKHHFDDFWARDSFFASWGSLAAGDFTEVRSNLDLFFRFQKKED